MRRSVHPSSHNALSTVDVSARRPEAFEDEEDTSISHLRERTLCVPLALIFGANRPFHHVVLGVLAAAGTDRHSSYETVSDVHGTLSSNGKRVGPARRPGAALKDLRHDLYVSKAKVQHTLRLTNPLERLAAGMSVPRLLHQLLDGVDSEPNVCVMVNRRIVEMRRCAGNLVEFAQRHGHFWTASPDVLQHDPENHLLACPPAIDRGWTWDVFARAVAAACHMGSPSMLWMLLTSVNAHLALDAVIASLGTASSILPVPNRGFSYDSSNVNRKGPISAYAGPGVSRPTDDRQDSLGWSPFFFALVNTTAGGAECLRLILDLAYVCETSPHCAQHQDPTISCVKHLAQPSAGYASVLQRRSRTHMPTLPGIPSSSVPFDMLTLLRTSSGLVSLFECRTRYGNRISQVLMDAGGDLTAHVNVIISAVAKAASASFNTVYATAFVRSVFGQFVVDALNAGNVGVARTVVDFCSSVSCVLEWPIIEARLVCTSRPEVAQFLSAQGISPKRPTEANAAFFNEPRIMSAEAAQARPRGVKELLQASAQGETLSPDEERRVARYRMQLEMIAKERIREAEAAARVA